MVGTGAYERKLQSILQAYPYISSESIKSWWDQPQFFEYWCSRLVAANPLQADTACIFSAHSVPISTVGTYEDEVISASNRIAKTIGLNHWYQAWQSAAPYGEWLGPTIEVSSNRLSGRAQNVLSVFPLDLLVTMWKYYMINDIVCRNIVEAAGAIYERLPMPNGNALFLEGMAQAYKKGLTSEVTIVGGGLTGLTASLLSRSC